MRRLMVGLMVVGLLAVAVPAMAQAPGSLDPLGLIVSGAVLPYFGADAGGSFSFLEVTSPTLPAEIHMFFFNAACTRVGDSANLGVTPNDVEFFQLDNVGNTPTSGLATAAATFDGFTLVPQTTPLHMRVLWVNVAGDFVRIVDPIAVNMLDDDSANDTGVYTPLRTGAAFFAPLEAGGLHTTIFLVCPNTNIAGAPGQASSTTRAFGPASGFSTLLPTPQAPGNPTSLRILVYDDDENLLRDTTSSCDCLTARPVTSISAVYGDISRAPFGTYSEVTAPSRQVTTPAVCDFQTFDVLATPGVPNPGNSCPLVPPTPPATVSTLQFHQISPAVTTTINLAFTGYRAIVTGTQPAGFDVFGRLSNANACDLNPAGCSTTTAR